MQAALWVDEHHPSVAMVRCGRFRCLSTEIYEFQKLLVMRHTSRTLAMPLPLKHSVCVLEYGGDLEIHSLRLASAVAPYRIDDAIPSLCLLLARELQVLIARVFDGSIEGDRIEI